tara:strand:+ start:380 stop:685 length:306 start_codon:yes stop_codon:yes gene_type:complete
MQYKAHWTTGGATDCGGITSPIRQHDPPLLFDVNTDPAEAIALDTSTGAYATIVAAMTTMRKAKQQDIDTSPRSVVNYKSSAAGKAANCCNETNVACRCNK